ncbi:MAG: hypothetical protein OEZ10_08745 [Gammaproteobacteria bacterium]|nr:hypothetical protein [Gammaproteobacteria bacterium]
MSVKKPSPKLQKKVSVMIRLEEPDFLALVRRAKSNDRRVGPEALNIVKGELSKQPNQ